MINLFFHFTWQNILYNSFKYMLTVYNNEWTEFFFWNCSTILKASYARVRPMLNSEMVNCISTANNENHFQNSWKPKHILDIWILLEFKFKSLSWSIKCTYTLAILRFIITSMYISKRTLLRIFEIVWIEYYISSCYKTYNQLYISF